MILCLDLGFKATGWCLFDGTTESIQDGRLIAPACGVIVPAEGLSPKALREKRKAEAFAHLARRLNHDLFWLFQSHRGNVDARGRRGFEIVAEVPSLGAQNAGAMRDMGMALACFESACEATSGDGFDVQVERYLRSDVVAAAFGRERPKGDVKAVVRRLVCERVAIDVEGVAEPLREHVYDAAATLFAARDAPSVRAQGWPPRALACLSRFARAGTNVSVRA